MVKINSNKPAFSLIEALVSMLILSVFFAAASKIVTAKPKPKTLTGNHGFFECYYTGTSSYSSNKLISNYKNAAAAPITVNNISQTEGCKFKPVVGAGFYNITIAFPHNKGCYFDTIPNIEGSIRIFPSLWKSSTNITDTKIIIYKDMNFVTEQGDGMEHPENYHYIKKVDDANCSWDEFNTYVKSTSSESKIRSMAGNSGLQGGVIISW